jgi:protein involved in polysaccharide export with SLBB domain
MALKWFVVPAAPITVGSQFVIGPEDLLQISVWKNESLSRQLPVRPDGKISLSLLHHVPACRPDSSPLPRGGC